MNTDPIAERARALLQAEALASGDFGEINFNEPRWNPWKIAEQAMVKFAAALTTTSQPEALERARAREVLAKLTNRAKDPRAGGAAFQGADYILLSVEELRTLEAALATDHPQTNLQENLAGSQTDAPASGEVERVARAMCDRVNGQGDYDANPVRHSGWNAQARTAIGALRSTPSEGARDSALEEAELEAIARIIDPEATTPGARSGTGKPFAGSVREREAFAKAAAIRALRTSKPEQEDHVVGFADTDVEQPEQAGAGFVMVPVEPTKAMLKAGVRELPVKNAAFVWSAMLAAAPQGHNSGEGE